MWVEGTAVYRSGAGAAERPVRIALDVRGLAIADAAGKPLDFWPFANLVRLPMPQPAVAVAVAGGEERIEVADPATAAALRTALRAVPVAGASRVPWAFLGALAGLAALLAGMVGVVLWLLSAAAEVFAPMVPAEVVTALDAAARADVLAALETGETEACRAAAGQGAIDRLAERLADTGGARDMPLAVHVYRSAIPNALALPGGSVVVTSALLDRIATADAFAGVLAHEIGHVHHRHGLRAVLHAGGLGLALATLTGDGGALATIAGALATARYSREAEREADDFAVDAVALGGGDPRALGAFLIALPGGDGPLDLLATHPMSEDRRAAIERRAADRSPRQGPLVPPADWAAIQAICR